MLVVYSLNVKHCSEHISYIKSFLLMTTLPSRYNCYHQPHFAGEEMGTQWLRDLLKITQWLVAKLQIGRLAPEPTSQLLYPAASHCDLGKVYPVHLCPWNLSCLSPSPGLLRIGELFGLTYLATSWCVLNQWAHWFITYGLNTGLFMSVTYGLNTGLFMLCYAVNCSHCNQRQS